MAVHWGPLGWALRRTGVAGRRDVWRWCDLSPPVSPDQIWALRRFDALVAGDDACVAVLRVLGAGDDVSTIPMHVDVAGLDPALGGARDAVLRIGWLTDRPGDAMFELLLAAKRLCEGAVAACGRCGSAAVGRFDPWQATLSRPSCCGSDLGSEPLAVEPVIATRPGHPGRVEFERLAAWLGIAAEAHWVEIDDQLTPAAVVGDWRAQLVLDDRPELAPGLLVAAAVGTPSVVAAFGAAGDLGLATTVDPVTRLTQRGAVRATPAPAPMTWMARKLLTGEGAAPQPELALDRLVHRARPEAVAPEWSALVERLAAAR